MNKYKIHIHRDGQLSGDEEALLFLSLHFNGQPDKGLSIGSLLCG